MAGWHKSCRAQDQRSGRTFRWNQWNTSAGAPGPDKSLPPFNSDQNRQEIREVNTVEKKKGDTHKKMGRTYSESFHLFAGARELGCLQILHNKEDNSDQRQRRQPMSILTKTRATHNSPGCHLCAWLKRPHWADRVIVAGKFKSYKNDNPCFCCVQNETLERCCFVVVSFPFPSNILSPRHRIRMDSRALHWQPAGPKLNSANIRYQQRASERLPSALIFIMLMPPPW